MKSVQIDTHGDIDVLEVRELPDATRTRDGAVLIRQVASSLNPVDWKTRAWDRGPKLPMTLGWDVAGVVVDTNSTDFEVGDRVVAMSMQAATGNGAWAELIELDASLVASAPHNLSLVRAAALPLTTMTARIALDVLAPEAGSRLLVTGVLGGVGRFAAQMAMAAGHRVDGLVRSESQRESAEALGLNAVLTDVTRADAGTYDAVFDTATVDPQGTLRDGGRYISITDDPLPAIPGATKPEVYEDGRLLRLIMSDAEAGIIEPRVAAIFDLGDVRAAHAAFEAGGLDGKVILLF